MALDHRILVYNFADLRLIYQWETIHNSKGLLAMSTQVDNTVVACPGVHVGQVRATPPHMQAPVNVRARCAQVCTAHAQHDTRWSHRCEWS